MQERNIIGGVTASVLSPFIEGWQQMLWFLILAIILILGDLRFGIAAAKKRGERIRPSRAVRRSINKLVDYICWLSIATVVGINFGTVFDIPLLSVIIMAVVCIIEMSSIIDNYLEYKGIKKKVNLIKLIAHIFRRPEVEDVLESTEQNEEKQENNESDK
ncbi:MAG: phage holin family protein [Prevotella sp.]|nr:phage holin family protein [Prevotella sp.]